MLSRVPPWTGEAPVPEPGSGLDGVAVATDFAVRDDGLVAFNSTASFVTGPFVSTSVDVRALLVDPKACAEVDDAIGLDDIGVPSAVAFTADGELLLQTVAPRDVIDVWDHARGLVTVDPPRETDSSVVLFHQSISGPIARAASCHPEGMEDGRVWTFARIDFWGVPTREVRRTMPLAGSLLSRMPYHWAGDLINQYELMHDTFEVRMDNGGISELQVTQLFDWLDGIRSVHTDGLDPAVVEKGRAAFTKAECDTCHSGPAYTDGAIKTVRPGVEAVKTPSLLGVGARRPLLHDGCAATLEQRFNEPCDDGTDQHGLVSLLDGDELTSLVVYLRTL